MRKRSSEERRRNKSPFTTYCTTAVACILLAACGMVFLMFGTDTVFIQVGMGTNSSNVDLPVSFEKTIREIAKDKATGGLGLGEIGTTGDPDIEDDDDTQSGSTGPYVPGVGGNLTLSADGAKISAVLKGMGYDDERCQQLGFLYDKLKNHGYPDEFCIGMISNQAHEGRVGQLQGSGRNIATRADIDAFLAGQKNGGVGMVQWTSVGRRNEICNRYIAANVFNADGTMNLDAALNVECDFIIDELESYGTYKVGQAEGATTARDFSETVHDNYEISRNSCANKKYTFMSYVKGLDPYGSECASRCSTAEKIVAGLNGGN